MAVERLYRRRRPEEGDRRPRGLGGLVAPFFNVRQQVDQQQVGRFLCTAEGDLLLIYLLQAEDDAKGGARMPVAFFRAPSPINAIDCQGAEIALGCLSGAVLLLRAALLLT